MSARITFNVEGDPVPQGSTRSFAKNGRVITTSDPTGRLERWRGDVRSAAKLVLPAGFEPIRGVVRLSAEFRIRRPQSHFLPANSRRPVPVLRPDAPMWCQRGPDTDKLVRAVMDALTLVVYVDDEQVVMLGRIARLWSTLPGALIDVGELLP